ncbi:ribonuclease H-like domain-containing protein [Tanacetum coccineum]
MIDYAQWEVKENGATFPKTTIMEGIVTVMPIIAAEEKAQRRLEVKSRSTLMMDIPNEHQLKFNSINDAKKLLKDVEKRFDDLYNNLKVYEPKVKGMSSSSSSIQNMAFVSSLNNNTSSTNGAVNTAHRVSTASTQVNAANSTNIDNLSNAVISKLTMRSRRFLKNTGRKLTVNGNKTIGFDKFKVECYNFHKKGHFARECRAARNQDNKNKESSRRSVPMEISTSIALVSCDGLGGYDWSPNSKVSNDFICLKSCLETVKLLKYQNDQLLKDLKKSELMVLDKFVNKLVVENYKAMSIEEEHKVVRKNDDAPCIKEWVSNNDEEDVSQPKTEKKIVRPSIVKNKFVKSKQQEKSARKTVKQVEQHRKNTHSPRGNQRNWNNMMSQKLGSNFEMFNKACDMSKNFNTAKLKAVVNVVKGNNFNAVKASTCWVWKPNHNVLDHGNPQIDYKIKNVLIVDCTRHRIGNMSYYTDYEEIDRGYVAFGGNPKGGKITGKYTIKTGPISNGLQYKKQVIMHVNLERRQNLSKITFCYHYGLLIHHIPKIQRVLMMMDLNLQEFLASSSNQARGSKSANTDSMSDVVIYSFFANQSNSPQLDNEDLEQIDADDLEEMDLKWQMAMLTMRAKRFLNKTGMKISSSGSKTIRFNKSKVECYNCHKKDQFTRECRALRENRNREPVRRNVTVETTETNALVTQDGLGNDWSDQAEERPKNFALMAYTSSGAYKASLESIEARLDMYKKNEVVFEEDIKISKLDIMLRDNALTELRKKFEKAEKEIDDLKLTLEKFENSSKNLRKLLEIQVSDKFKTGRGYDSQVVDGQVFDSHVNDKYKIGEGYHAVLPPYTRNFMPPKPNLVLANEEEYVFTESITGVPAVATSKVNTSESKPKSVIEPLIEDWIFDNEYENETKFMSKQ